MRNLLHPFRRDRKHDLASGTGKELLRARVLQTLMTRGATPRSSGELPWRTSFGAGLDLLRNQPNNDVFAELARVYVRDALAQWTPEVDMVDVTAHRDKASLNLRVQFRGVDGLDQSLGEAHARLDG